MATITVWNKGKRTWPVKNAEGKDVQLSPQESVEMDEVAGRRLCMGYPKDLTTSGIAGPSASDLARREQSLKDRMANLDKREAELNEWGKDIQAKTDALAEAIDKLAGRTIELDEREKAIKAREDADKPKRGRPAKDAEKPSEKPAEEPEAE